MLADVRDYRLRSRATSGVGAYLTFGSDSHEDLVERIERWLQEFSDRNTTGLKIHDRGPNPLGHGRDPENYFMAPGQDFAYNHKHSYGYKPLTHMACMDGCDPTNPVGNSRMKRGTAPECISDILFTRLHRFHQTAKARTHDSAVGGSTLLRMLETKIVRRTLSKIARSSAF